MHNLKPKSNRCNFSVALLACWTIKKPAREDPPLDSLQLKRAPSMQRYTTSTVYIYIIYHLLHKSSLQSPAGPAYSPTSLWTGSHQPWSPCERKPIPTSTSQKRKAMPLCPLIAVSGSKLLPPNPLLELTEGLEAQHRRKTQRGARAARSPATFSQTQFRVCRRTLGSWAYQE